MPRHGHVRREVANSVGAHGSHTERSCEIITAKTNSMLKIVAMMYIPDPFHEAM
jgi:hypothetical protein